TPRSPPRDRPARPPRAAGSVRASWAAWHHWSVLRTAPGQPEPSAGPAARRGPSPTTATAASCRCTPRPPPARRWPRGPGRPCLPPPSLPPWNQVRLSWPASSVTIPVDASPRGSIPSPRSQHHPTRIPRPWAVRSADVGHAQFAQRAGHRLARRVADLLVVEGEADRRLDQADVGAAIEARAAEAIGVDLLLAKQAGDGVGELDL